MVKLAKREEQIMQVFWRQGELNIAAVREALAQDGFELAYTTVASQVKILLDKRFLRQTNSERPFRFVPERTYEDVSGRLLGDLVEQVFQGSRQELLLRLVKQKRLTSKERAFLERILVEQRG